MKRLFLSVAMVMVMATGAMAADREVYLEATHDIDVDNPEFSTSDIDLKAVARFSIWKGLGIDSSVSGSLARSYENAVVTVGPRYVKGNLEASVTTSFAVDNTSDFGDNAQARVRFNF
jgi:hypothetical protein